MKAKAATVKEDYPYPSKYGSHSSMINEEETAKLTDANLVVCSDETGNYTTSRERLDTRLADPNRYHSDRFVNFFQKEKKNSK